MIALCVCVCVCELRYSDADTDVNGDFWCVVLFWGAFCYREHINPVHCQAISDMKEKIQGEKNRRNKKKTPPCIQWTKVCFLCPKINSLYKNVNKPIMLYRTRPVFIILNQVIVEQRLGHQTLSAKESFYNSKEKTSLLKCKKKIPLKKSWQTMHTLVLIKLYK